MAAHSDNFGILAIDIYFPSTCIKPSSLMIVTSLIEKYEICPTKMGRLEVGAETVIGKSKAIKTFSMQIFKVYAEGPALQTGGAASIARVVWPNASIAFEIIFRGSHISHAYDFTSQMLQVNTQVYFLLSL
ncbi:hypothetical protein DITRI_Ditri04bG0184800 [Diplodiscus trichospermus]